MAAQKPSQSKSAGILAHPLKLNRQRFCHVDKKSEGKRSPEEIIAEDQGGAEFDPKSGNQKNQEPKSNKKGNPKENTADIDEAAEEDQGGREFEPLPVKRILVD